MKIMPSRREGQSFVINDGEVIVTIMSIEDGKVICGVSGGRSVCTEETFQKIKERRGAGSSRTLPAPLE